MRQLLRELRPSLTLFVVLTLITGVAYPLVVTAIGLTVFPAQARGSIVERDGKPVGSTLIAQPFSSDRYLWPRPSAAGYNAAASSGSNLGPTNPLLADAVRGRVETIASDAATRVPADLVTASGSGLDPHVSPESARLQAARIAGARGVSVDVVQKTIDQHTESRTFGLLGEPRVNVLQVNLALDGLAGQNGRP